jgi:hypothetical protein
MAKVLTEDEARRIAANIAKLPSSGWSMSALLPKADIRQHEWHVRYVP